MWVVASAADTTTGDGSGVAYGTGSSAPKAENVAVGKGAAIQYSNGASAATGDIEMCIRDRVYLAIIKLVGL